MWQALRPEERRPYDQKAEMDKQRYEEELKNWKSKNKLGSDGDEESSYSEASDIPFIRK